ncbi:MarR family winged helix-turn-helix transcriptional regulator [Denitrobaculum tricleocarpae]|uniref:MarR family transcriptional regulator n=1 Tax=Denitrobaculum tricleocarpae TaxID=2591009 RepID=A0A545TT26_9PROT|nr:MarR family transcriptional regulator [Denitrobaculum tricleocarpae]TQV80379.1 MarR family transcriptional regulator [Denitrobaculum tricleocarpae]
MKDSQQSSPDSLYELIRLVRPLYKTLESSVAQELERTGISVSQRAVLEQLLDHGPITVPAIGRQLMLPRQFIQKIANELFEQELIRRRENEAHKRSVLLELTDKGEGAIAVIKEREAEVMLPIAAALNSDDLAITRTVITEIIRAFSAHNSDFAKKG